MTIKFSKKKKWIATDAWRGHDQPVYAVAGASDTGMAADSPARSDVTRSEISTMRAYLRKKGFHTATTSAQSSNVFMRKAWIIVPPEEYDAAKKEADKYIEDTQSETQNIHEADRLVEHKKRKMKRL